MSMRNLSVRVTPRDTLSYGAQNETRGWRNRDESADVQIEFTCDLALANKIVAYFKGEFWAPDAPRQPEPPSDASALPAPATRPNSFFEGLNAALGPGPIDGEFEEVDE